MGSSRNRYKMKQRNNWGKKGGVFPHSLKYIKMVSIDIISDDEWVNDSKTMAEHKGIVSGLNRLINHLTEMENETI